MRVSERGLFAAHSTVWDSRLSPDSQELIALGLRGEAMELDRLRTTGVLTWIGKSFKQLQVC